MEFIGGVQNMNFTPISNYNGYLKNNDAFKLDDSNMDFENILSKQTAQLQGSATIQGGVQANSNLDDIAAQATVQPAGDSSPTSSFIKSFSSSLNSGINSVNNNVTAANKAQEAFAAGEDVSVHDVMIAAEKASLSLSMGMQLRNKLMNAYSEINNVKV